MDMLHTQWKRKFSLSMYKNLKIDLGEMSFYKDFVNDTRGDLYPVVEKSGDCLEWIGSNSYYVERGSVERVLCQFFPFATYEARAKKLSGKMGFVFRLPDVVAKIYVLRGASGQAHAARGISCEGNASQGASEAKLCYCCGEHTVELELPAAFTEASALIVSCRPGAFDVYYEQNGKAEYLTTVEEKRFADANCYSVFSESYVSFLASGEVEVSQVLSYLDNGVSIADFRPLKYEDGTVIYENGKVYFTASIRIHSGNYQAIFSWVPGTMQFEMTGALFFDPGDGFWRSYIASTLVYHREHKKWYVWTSSFEHEHVLARGSFEGEPRFGINVADVTLMDKASADSDMTEFLGFRGDEDPDLIYDAKKDRWILGICRLHHRTKKYIYVFFESKDPLSGFQYIGCGAEGASETGGVFVRKKDEIYFVCGNDFDKRSEYRIYSEDGMKTAEFRYPDGGFRGWGCVMPVKLAARTRYFWLTFDRHNGSDYNWSYGNVYCFEAM